MLLWSALIVVPLLAVLLLGVSYGPLEGPKSKHSTASGQVGSIAAIVGYYRKQEGRLPSSLEELKSFVSGGNESLVPDDPWGRPYEYRLDGPADFTLRSYGEDGQRDTDDDVIYERAK